VKQDAIAAASLLSSEASRLLPAKQSPRLSSRIAGPKRSLAMTDWVQLAIAM
jgi:hypothetical protein